MSFIRMKIVWAGVGCCLWVIAAVLLGFVLQRAWVVDEASVRGRALVFGVFSASSVLFGAVVGRSAWRFVLQRSAGSVGSIAWPEKGPSKAIARFRGSPMVVFAALAAMFILGLATFVDGDTNPAWISSVAGFTSLYFIFSFYYFSNHHWANKLS